PLPISVRPVVAPTTVRPRVRPAALADVAGARPVGRGARAGPVVPSRRATCPVVWPAPVTVTTPGGLAAWSVRSCAAPVVVAASTVVRRSGPITAARSIALGVPTPPLIPGVALVAPATRLGVAAVLPARPTPAVVVALTALVLDASALVAT